MRPLRERADQVFERINSYPGDGLRNHCLRLAEYARLHAGQMGIRVDPDLVHAAAMLHDLGLLLRPEPGGSYVDRSWALAYRELHVGSLEPHAAKVLEHSLRYNHSLRREQPIHGCGQYITIKTGYAVSGAACNPLGQRTEP